MFGVPFLTNASGVCKLDCGVASAGTPSYFSSVYSHSLLVRIFTEMTHYCLRCCKRYQCTWHGMAFWAKSKLVNVENMNEQQFFPGSLLWLKQLLSINTKSNGNLLVPSAVCNPHLREHLHCNLVDVTNVAVHTYTT